jgi:hypothetical protein
LKRFPCQAADHDPENEVNLQHQHHPIPPFRLFEIQAHLSRPASCGGMKAIAPQKAMPRAALASAGHPQHIDSISTGLNSRKA